MAPKKYKYIYGRSDDNKGSIAEKEVKNRMSIDKRLANQQAHIDVIYGRLAELKEIVKSQSYQIADLRKRVKKLEQNGNYPNKEELKNLRREGND